MNLPIDIDSNSSVLISGAGGGFDFLCGYPIGEMLLDKGFY